MHSYAGYTYPNLIASTYGHHPEELYYKNNLKRVDSYAKDSGYITGMTSDSCTIGEFDEIGKIDCLID